MEINNLKVPPFTIKTERQIKKKMGSVLEGPDSTLNKLGKEIIFWSNF